MSPLDAKTNATHEPSKDGTAERYLSVAEEDWQCRTQNTSTGKAPITRGALGHSNQTHLDIGGPQDDSDACLMGSPSHSAASTSVASTAGSLRSTGTSRKGGSLGPKKSRIPLLARASVDSKAGGTMLGSRGSPTSKRRGKKGPQEPQRASFSAFPSRSPLLRDVPPRAMTPEGPLMTSPMFKKEKKLTARAKSVLGIMQSNEALEGLASGSTKIRAGKQGCKTAAAAGAQVAMHGTPEEAKGLAKKIKEAWGGLVSPLSTSSSALASKEPGRGPAGSLGTPKPARLVRAPVGTGVPLASPQSPSHSAPMAGLQELVLTASGLEIRPEMAGRTSSFSSMTTPSLSRANSINASRLPSFTSSRDRREEQGYEEEEAETLLARCRSFSAVPQKAPPGQGNPLRQSWSGIPQAPTEQTGSKEGFMRDDKQHSLTRSKLYHSHNSPLPADHLRGGSCKSPSCTVVYNGKAQCCPHDDDQEPRKEYTMQGLLEDIERAKKAKLEASSKALLHSEKALNVNRQNLNGPHINAASPSQLLNKVGATTKDVTSYPVNIKLRKPGSSKQAATLGVASCPSPAPQAHPPAPQSVEYFSLDSESSFECATPPFLSPYKIESPGDGQVAGQLSGSEQDASQHSGTSSPLSSPDLVCSPVRIYHREQAHQVLRGSGLVPKLNLSALGGGLLGGLANLMKHSTEKHGESPGGLTLGGPSKGFNPRTVYETPRFFSQTGDSALSGISWEVDPPLANMATTWEPEEDPVAEVEEGSSCLEKGEGDEVCGSEIPFPGYPEHDDQAGPLTLRTVAEDDVLQEDLSSSDLSRGQLLSDIPGPVSEDDGDITARVWEH